MMLMQTQTICVRRYAPDEEETTSDSSAPSDEERLKVALSAEAETDDPYGLMLVHFSDIDSQGHCCGVEQSGDHNSYVKEKYL